MEPFPRGQDAPVSRIRQFRNGHSEPNLPEAASERSGGRMNCCVLMSPGGERPCRTPDRDRCAPGASSLLRNVFANVALLLPSQCLPWGL